MNWSCFVCLVLVSLVWQCPVIYSSPLTTTPDTVSQPDVDCPSSCVLALPNGPSTIKDIVDQEGLNMTSRKLNPIFYEASRAGHAIQHYINTIYGSPFRLYAVTQIHNARTEDMGESGMKYIVEFSVKDTVGESSEGRCSAEVLYPRGETQRPPQVQCSCDGLPRLNTSDKEQEFYQQYRANSNVTANDLPDSYGHMEPDMVPFWNLGRLVASFVMLNQSNENTLYNLAQVSKLQQLKSEDDQLNFEYEVLLHEMVSQEIIRWKLLIAWSPAKSVKVLESELLPRCRCN
ncbi:latexin isoform X2 [Tachysurus vachellii]|uniref:latexin isoform X1 n=1 Tax=Tachysurus vachellii TaxID=175792 RepID=UPI00296AA0D3|nr:latexin isoform X1 [Tachysurus vachellii]XP_060731210.1 latexin isoform X2 [Tachysurus vachellii]